MTMPVGLRCFRLAAEWHLSYNNPFQRINCCGIIPLPTIESKDPFCERFVHDVIGVASRNFDHTHNVQRTGIEDGHRTAATVAREGEVQVRCKCHSVRFVVFADIHFSYHGAIRIKHHDIRPTANEDSVRRRACGEVIPSAITPKTIFFTWWYRV